jgi:hypothetical protein
MGDLGSSDQELPSDDELESSPRLTFEQYPENHSLNLKFHFTAADGKVYNKKSGEMRAGTFLPFHKTYLKGQITLSIDRHLDIFINGDRLVILSAYIRNKNIHLYGMRLKTHQKYLLKFRKVLD